MIRLQCQFMGHYDHCKKTDIHHAGWSLLTQCKFHISWNPVMRFVIEMRWHNPVVIQQPAKHFKMINQPHKEKRLQTHTHKNTHTLQQKTRLIKNSLMINEPYNCTFNILHTHEANLSMINTKTDMKCIWHKNTPKRKTVSNMSRYFWAWQLATDMVHDRRCCT